MCIRDRSLTASLRHPEFAFMAVPKSGCTFLRNLAYILDHGRHHPDPLAIQADDCLYRMRIAPQGADGTAFIVLRDPVARFLSLYFDKVIGGGPHGFGWIARRIAQRVRFRTGPGLSLAEHRRNCHHLADYIARRIARQGAEEVNPHWRPQSVFAAKAGRFGLRALTLEGLAHQLPAHLGAAIPGLAATMGRLGRLNTAPRPEGVEGLVDAGLESRILQIYGPDRALHEAVGRAWERDGKAPRLGHDLPV